MSRAVRGKWLGGVAQLGERVNGIHEVRGSIPLASISSARRDAGEPAEGSGRATRASPVGSPGSGIARSMVVAAQRAVSSVG